MMIVTAIAFFFFGAFFGMTLTALCQISGDSRYYCDRCPYYTGELEDEED